MRAFHSQTRIYQERVDGRHASHRARVVGADHERIDDPLVLTERRTAVGRAVLVFLVVLLPGLILLSATEPLVWVLATLVASSWLVLDEMALRRGSRQAPL